MPLYEYDCECGRFESFRSDRCPVCGHSGKKLLSVPALIKVYYGESLPLGNKSRGRFIPPEGNRAGILVPSFGALEKEEVDYLAEASLEKEKTRVRKSEQKEALENVTKILLNTPHGQRGKKLKEIGGN